MHLGHNCRCDSVVASCILFWVVVWMEDVGPFGLFGARCFAASGQRSRSSLAAERCNCLVIALRMQPFPEPSGKYP
jgi:hypothetical protein